MGRMPGRNGSFALLATSLSVSFLSLLFVAPALRAEELKIGGTGNALGSMRLLAEAFSQRHPQVKVTVLSSLGSSGAIKAVPKRAIDIGLTSRPLSDEELAGGSKAIEYARSPTVIAVSVTSKVSSITRQQLADLYAGKLADWPDGTPIRPVLRQPGDDNTRQLASLSPAIADALRLAERRQGLAFAVIDQEAADKLEGIPGAIGVSSLALILSEGRRLKPLALDGVEPSIENASAGTYPIYKRFYFVTAQEPSGTVKRFIEFALSAPGRDVLAKTGHWFP